MSNLYPKFGENDKPLVSVFIHTQKFAPHLRLCLDSVYAQTYNNIEIIFFDTSATVDSWDIALEYAEKYPGTMTMGRNRLNYDQHLEQNNDKKLNPFWKAAKALYLIELDPDEILGPEHVNHFVMMKKASLNEPAVPLVSVFVYNYNYGRYLRQCFESIFAQTHQNIEVLFSDNDSTDDSWNIALEYAKKYPDKMTIMRNRQNMGAQSNSENCYRMAKGKYFVLLCSDDALLPEFVEQCVNAMEQHQRAKFAMVHRKIIDASGNVADEPSFYNQSCIITGEEQAAVYMMAAVNPSISQVMYNRELAFNHTTTEGLVERWLNYRILDFSLCFKSDLIYIKEPLILHRIHSESDTNAIDHSLIEIFSQFIFVHQCAEKAEGFQFGKAADRLPQAIDKIGVLCLRYCLMMLKENNEESARKYFHLSQAIMPEIIETKTYKRLHTFWQSDDAKKQGTLKSLLISDQSTSRTISYDPPPHSVPIALK